MKVTVLPGEMFVFTILSRKNVLRFYDFFLRRDFYDLSVNYRFVIVVAIVVTIIIIIMCRLYIPLVMCGP